MTYPLLDEAATEALLPYPRLADEIAAVLRERAAGALRIAERTALALERGTLLCMPAADARLLIAKVVTVHPGNAQLGRPSITGEVVVADAATGERLALLDGGAVTRRRTAALSLLAARLLAARLLEADEEPGATGRRTLLVYGAGDQARGHCEAFAGALGADLEVVIATRPGAQSQPRAAELAAHLRSLGVAASLTSDPDGAVPRADLIVTATTSREPVLTTSPRPGALVCAVGAFRHDMAELSPAVIGGAARVVVDTRAGAEAEAGDLIQAAAAGTWQWSAAEELVDALAARPASATGYTVFKSVGHAMYDLAAARVAFPSAPLGR